MKKTILLIASFMVAMTASAQSLMLNQKTEKSVTTEKSNVEGVDSIVTYATTVTKTIEHVRDSIVIDTIQNIHTHEDSIRVVKAAVTVADSTRRGHYVQVFLGGGYSGMGNKVDVANGSAAHLGHMGGLFHAQYAFFFHENMGLSAGLGVSTYGGGAGLNGVAKDSVWSAMNSGWYYNQHALKDVKARQRMWLFDVPIAMQFQGLLNPKVGLYGSVGVAISMPLNYTRWYADGVAVNSQRESVGPAYFEIEHKVDEEYAYTTKLPKEFRTTAWGSSEKQKLQVAPVQVGVTADFGVILPIDYQNEILVGVYGRCNVLNSVKENSFDVSDQEVQLDYRHGVAPADWRTYKYYNHTGIAEHKEMRPWQVGIKIGYQWRYVRRTTVVPIEYRKFQVSDTTYNYKQRTEKSISYTTESVTTYTYDTIMSPVDEIRRLMDKAIIWFDFDSYVPKLDPVDILDNIATILVQYPNLKVEVNGHTCTIGRRAYNQKLSERRAKAVADRLQALGVAPDQMIIQGFCSDKPYFSESHQLYLDRRCEIVPIEETNEKHILHKETKGENASKETVEQ